MHTFRKYVLNLHLFIGMVGKGTAFMFIFAPCVIHY